MTQTGQLVDPFRNFNFLVEIDGITQAGFSECSGLASTTEVIEFREGGDNTTVHKLPGKTSYADITLKWGTTDNLDLWNWRQQIIDGQVVRKTGALILFDLAGSTEVARWNFVRAWPTKCELPSFSAKGNDVAIETLVLAHEGLTRA
ncbi:phage tail protein [Streptomyces sp. NBC_00124]|uniref:phage tail protein n=1 Tax=Streptomyces sp. NBC_00124 TaxID=2975662 RepID=UPI0022511C99|nr:phage tail protein [Streptomyces sp. NBC_00124]MCX5357766.1 phage tail protein [Streptomyces sp. NBC_00124]